MVEPCKLPPDVRRPFLSPFCFAQAPKILIIEGLHPFYDDRVNDLIDFRIYLDISGELKTCSRPAVTRHSCLRCGPRWLPTPGHPRC